MTLPRRERRSGSAGKTRKFPKDAQGAGRPTQSHSTVNSLYAEYAAHLSATIRRMYGDGPPDPDDVAQEAFRRVMEKGELSSIRNLKAFVWRIARNIVLKEKQKVVMRTRYDFEVEEIFFPLRGDNSSPEKIIKAREQLKLVSRLIDAMPEKRRRAFILHRIEGLNVAETARRLGISRTAAVKRIAKAVAEIETAFVEETQQ